MNKDMFFYRTHVFGRDGEKVYIVEKEKLDNKVCLEPWLGVVVSLADGRHTVGQLVEFLKGSYTFPPSNLEETLESVMGRLIEAGIIAFSEAPAMLPYYLSMPKEEQDHVKSMDLMIKDGFLKN